MRGPRKWMKQLDKFHCVPLFFFWVRRIFLFGLYIFGWYWLLLLALGFIRLRRPQRTPVVFLQIVDVLSFWCFSLLCLCAAHYETLVRSGASFCAHFYMLHRLSHVYNIYMYIRYDIVGGGLVAVGTNCRYTQCNPMAFLFHHSVSKMQCLLLWLPCAQHHLTGASGAAPGRQYNTIRCGQH